jgi:hypothetical protein
LYFIIFFNFGRVRCLAMPLVHFVLVTLEMKSHELFAWAGLEPESSQSQPPK